MNIAHYAKFLVTLAVPALLVFTVLPPDQEPNLITLFKVLVAIGGAAAVYQISNGESGFVKYAKFWAALAVAPAQAILVLLEQGLGFTDFSWGNWAGVLLALIGATGVIVIPNGPKLLGADGALIYETDVTQVPDDVRLPAPEYR